MSHVLSWKQYSVRKWLFIMSIPCGFGAMAWLAQGEKSIWPFVGFFGWFSVVVLPLGYRHVTCPCPNCQRPIHFAVAFGSPLGSKCLHCGIKVGQLAP